MKIRQGFVSNSRSASFVVALSVLTPDEVDKIMNYLDNDDEEGWGGHIDERKGIITGWTTMDNEYFSDWLKAQGLLDKFTWESD